MFKWPTKPILEFSFGPPRHSYLKFGPLVQKVGHPWFRAISSNSPWAFYICFEGEFIGNIFFGFIELYFLYSCFYSIFIDHARMSSQQWGIKSDFLSRFSLQQHQHKNKKVDTTMITTTSLGTTSNRVIQTTTITKETTMLLTASKVNFIRDSLYNNINTKTKKVDKSTITTTTKM